MEKTMWQKVINEIPEIIPRLRDLRKEHPDYNAKEFAKVLNAEFEAVLAKLETKIWPQQLKKILEPEAGQFTKPNGNEPTVKDLAEDEKKILALLKKSSQTVVTVSEHLGIPKEDVFPAIDKLRLKGYDVVVEQSQVFLQREPVEGQTIILPPITKQTIKFLVMSDICLGLKTQQGDLLATAYKIGEEEGVFFGIIAGNLVAGKPVKTKSNEYFLHDFEEQVGYVISKFPKASFKTYFINGPRELSFTKDGINIGEVIAGEREDLVYCGDEKAVFDFGKGKIKASILHAGENSSYTKSYPLQGVKENFQESITYAFEHSDPLQMVFVGGIHSYVLIPRRLPISCGKYNDFDAVAIPSLYRATGSQKAKTRKGMSPVLGCIIVTLKFDNTDNLISIKYDARDLTAYHKDDDYLEEIKIDERLTDEEKEVLFYLKNKPRRKGEISRFIKKSDSSVEKIIENFKSYGYDIDFDGARKSYKFTRDLKEIFKPLELDVKLLYKKLYVKTVKAGATGDPHLGCKDARADLIPKTYEIAEKEKVDIMAYCGDTFEGEDAYPGQRRDLVRHGADEQRDYGLEVWPKSKIPTVFVRGTSHELSYLQKCGHDIVDTFIKIAPLKGLHNLKYLGGHRGIVDVKGIKIELIHPKGGIPYGISYRPQKRIEQLVSIISPGDAKITLCGHLHVAAAMIYKGIAAFLVPCLEEQTEYLSAKGLIPWLGMWLIEASLDEYDNITRLVTEYIPFEPKNEEVKTIKIE